MSGDTSRLQQSLCEAVSVAQDAGVRITRAGQSFTATFGEALNPTKKLTRQIALLETATAPPPAGGTAPEEPGEPGQGATAAGWEAAGSHVDLRGATVFGYDEFARRVAEAQAQNAPRSGLLAPA